MDIGERLNRALTWSLTCLLVVPACTVLMRVLNRTRIVGKHHLQGARLPFVFVSNHVTIFDDGLVDTLIFSPRVFREYDFIPHHVPEERNFFKGRLVSWFMRRMKCIPVRRGEGIFQPAMDRIIAARKDGGCVRTFPEGRGPAAASWATAGRAWAGCSTRRVCRWCRASTAGSTRSCPSAPWSRASGSASRS